MMQITINGIRLRQYHKYDPNYNIAETDLFKFKPKKTERTPTNSSSKGFERSVSLKYLINFGGTLKMQLSNCKVKLLLNWSVNCIITNSTDA